MATEHLRADPKLVPGLGEPLLGGRTFDLDLAQPGADLLARQRVILGEVEQLLLADGQLRQLLAVALMELSHARLLSVDCLLDGFRDQVTEGDR
ncbi:hypothetical protein IEE94_14495 [Yimella sp. cx-573]|nr:hypothetical protein [Yimella sp. cx-573]